jgi:hypothetical protein
MKIITTQHVLSISGGCQKAVDKYEASAGFYELVGAITGASVALAANLSGPVRVLTTVAGAYVGLEAGYVFGATSYWVNRAIHKTTDSFLKPAL